MLQYERSFNKFLEYLLNEMNIIENYIEKEKDKIVMKKINLGTEISVINREKLLISESSDSDKIENMIRKYRKIREVYNFVKIISSDSSKLCFEYGIISDVLINSDLNIRDQFGALLFIVKCNFKNGNMSNPLYPTYALKEEDVLNYKFKYSTSDEVLKLITDNKSKFSDDSKNLLKKIKEKKKKEEILQFLNNYKLFNYEGQKAHIIIEFSYMSNKEYNGNDIKNLITAFKKLGVNDKLCQMINNYLSKELIKKQSSNLNTKINISMNKTEVNDKPNLSKKEYHNIMKELFTYFDIDTMTAKKTMTMDEIIIFLKLLQKLNLEDKKIIEILDIINKKNKKLNPIGRLNDIYEKIQYYDDKISTENIELLKLYLQEICLIQSYQEYEKNKSDLNELLNIILDEIPKTYEYEFNKLQKCKE